MAKKKPEKWTDETTEKWKGFIRDGLSAQEISDQTGHTRDTVRSIFQLKRKALGLTRGVGRPKRVRPSEKQLARDAKKAKSAERINATAARNAQIAKDAEELISQGKQYTGAVAQKHKVSKGLVRVIIGRHRKTKLTQIPESIMIKTFKKFLNEGHLGHAYRESGRWMKRINKEGVGGENFGQFAHHWQHQNFNDAAHHWNKLSSDEKVSAKNVIDQHSSGFNLMQLFHTHMDNMKKTTSGNTEEKLRKQRQSKNNFISTGRAFITNIFHYHTTKDQSYYRHSQVHKDAIKKHFNIDDNHSVWYDMTDAYGNWQNKGLNNEHLIKELGDIHDRHFKEPFNGKT